MPKNKHKNKDNTTEDKIKLLRKIQENRLYQQNLHFDNTIANRIAEDLINHTKTIYNNIAKSYKKKRYNYPHKIDVSIWNQLLYIAYSRFYPSTDNPIRILDIGTAYGRDIKYASELPYVRIVGIEISDSFIELLRLAETNREIPSGSYLKCDMRNLSFISDKSFEIVRHNASLVHMPITSKNSMADLAIKESHRVLRSKGLLYVSVKEGKGIKFIKSKEGFGKIFYQFYPMETITNLINENGFNILSKGYKPSSRGGSIKWISIIAEKN